MSRWWVRVLLPVAALLAVLLAGPPGASAVPPSVSLAADDIVGGIHVDQAVADLNDDGVAVVSSPTSVPQLQAIVRDARDRGLKFGVLVTGTSMSQADCTQLAGILASKTGLTVLVLTPNPGKAVSSELSASVLQSAEQAAAAQGLDDVAATRAFVDAATEKSTMPWLLGGGVVLVVLLGLLWWLWTKRRGRSRTDHELQDLADGLQRRLSALAPQILGLADRVDALGRPDLEARFDQASADYSRLEQTLGDPMHQRTAVNETATAVGDLERRLDQLDREVDALAPGLEPPSPAG